MRTKLMLIAFLGLAILPGAGQTSGAGNGNSGSSVLDRLDFGLTFTEKFAKISETTGDYFNMPGGSLDVAYRFHDMSRFAIAADVQGEAATHPVNLGYSLSQMSFVAGPRYTLWREPGRGYKANIYGEALFGGVHAWDSLFIGSSGSRTSANSWTMQFGGGLNIPVTKRFGWRVIEGDYIISKLPNMADDFQSDVRLSTGLNFRLGKVAPPPPVTLACLASPTSIYPGDPVTVTAAAGNLDPKLDAIYSWSGSGVSGKGAVATVDTGALAAGSYTVKCGVKEGKPGKKGLEPWEMADASASFTVKAYEPPKIICSVGPSVIMLGETSTVTAAAFSPQNRPLTYSYSAVAGSISGSGASATFSSAGAPSGSVQIACNVSDDKGQTATATASVVVQAPIKAAPSPEIKELETKLALHSIYFPTARPTDKDPSGGLMESQQLVLASLAISFQRYLTFKPDAHLILGGHADSRGSIEYNKALTERRVERAKSFLVEHGVPAGDIQVQSFGMEDQLNAEQVRQLVEQNPDLSEGERQKMLKDLPVIVLANNRRVDVTLSTTGQQSVRLYPFNARDAFVLIGAKGVEKEPVVKKTPRK